MMWVSESLQHLLILATMTRTKDITGEGQKSAVSQSPVNPDVVFYETHSDV